MINTLSLLLGLTLIHADGATDLNKDCYEKKRGRSCVQLGNLLWQTRERRGDAIRAFTKGCELKEESACTLKNLKFDPVKTVEAKAVEPKITKAKSLFPKGAVVATDTEGSYTIKRSVALETAQDLSGVFESATLEQSLTKGGTVHGYRFKEIDPGSVFEMMGFQVGDVITHVNGKPMTSTAEASALLPSLVYESYYKVRLIRSGKPRQHTYEVI